MNEAESKNETGNAAVRSERPLKGGRRAAGQRCGIESEGDHGCWATAEQNGQRDWLQGHARTPVQHERSGSIQPDLYGRQGGRVHRLGRYELLMEAVRHAAEQVSYATDCAPEDPGQRPPDE